MTWLTLSFTSSGISPVLNHDANDYSNYLVFYVFPEPFRMADYFVLSSIFLFVLFLYL